MNICYDSPLLTRPGVPPRAKNRLLRSEQKRHRQMQTRGPEELVMIVVLKKQALKINAFLVALRLYQRVCLGLIRRVLLVQACAPMVKIELMCPRFGQVFAQVTHKILTQNRPVRAQASRLTKDLRIFRQRVKRNQTTHTRAHHRGVFSIVQHAILAVDKRLDILHN